MLKECDLDAVSLALPPFVHEPATVAAAKLGKHVFCEKPMARTATEARNMRDACDAAGVKLAYQSGGTCLDRRVTPSEITSPLVNSAMSTTAD